MIGGLNTYPTPQSALLIPLPQLKGEVDAWPDKWPWIDLYLINNLLKTLSPQHPRPTPLRLSIRSQKACETRNEQRRGDAWVIYRLINKSWPNILLRVDTRAARTVRVHRRGKGEETG